MTGRAEQRVGIDVTAETSSMTAKCWCKSHSKSKEEEVRLRMLLLSEIRWPSKITNRLKDTNLPPTSIIFKDRASTAGTETVRRADDLVSHDEQDMHTDPTLLQLISS